MISRILPQSEWDRIAADEMVSMLRFVKPEDLQVLVVEDDAGKIVARMFVAKMTHLEGAMVDPEHRSATLALLRLTAQVAGEWATEAVLAGSREGDDEMLGILARLGAERLKVQFFALGLKES